MVTGTGVGLYLYDGLGQSNLVLLDVQRLHPPPLLLVQDLTQLRGHFGLIRETPGVKTNASHIQHKLPDVLLVRHILYCFSQSETSRPGAV